jgi:hypothetical protein
MNRCSAMLMALAVAAVAQVHTTESKAILTQIIQGAQKQIKPALGECATCCFTDHNYDAFKKSDRARAIAQEAARSSKFDQAIQGLRKLSAEQREKILSDLSSIRQKTVAENDGNFGPQSQTEAGASAQHDIAAEIVKAVDTRLTQSPAGKAR